MKKALITFLHKPLLVTGVSLVIAGGIGAFAYDRINTVPAYAFIEAQSGTISEIGTQSATSSERQVSLGFTSGGRVASVSVKVGSEVKKGQILATLDPEGSLGAITQAQAAYASAKANYDKVVHGATGSTIDVAQTAVDTAEQNLSHILSTAPTQIDNTIRTNIDNLYQNVNTYSPQFVLSFYDSTTNTTVNLEPTDVGQKLDLGFKRVDIGKVISAWQGNPNIPADQALSNLRQVQTFLTAVSAGVNGISYQPKYQANIDKYKSNIATAKSTVDGLITSIENAQQSIVTAKASLSSVTSAARSEDVTAAKAQMESAYGSLQIAEAALKNKQIIAPGDGVVTAVHVKPGEIAMANASAIELSGTSFTKEVAVLIPKTAVRSHDGKNYVLVKSPTNKSGVEEREVTLGTTDNTNVEVVSGLQAGEQIAQ